MAPSRETEQPQRFRLHRHTHREGNRGTRKFATLYRGDREILDASFEAYVASGATHTRIGLEIGDCASLKIRAGISHIANVWLGIDSGPLAGWLYRRGGRLYRWFDAASERHVIDVSVHHGAIWWNIWHPLHEWHSGTPRWRHGNFNPVDWALGRRQLTSEVIEGPKRVDIPMPERTYPATVTIELDRRKRPRWPWATESHSYKIDILKDVDGCPGYIPVPGKGENSWDCGGDGIFGQSGPGRTVEAAIAGVVEGALRDRRRRGAAPDYAEAIS